MWLAIVSASLLFGGNAFADDSLQGGWALTSITNAEGVVVGVNVYRNRRPHGDLGFWASALDARVRARYGATQRVEIATNSGVEGIQIRAATARDGRPHRYWATVFVTGRNVVLVEAGGDEAHFSGHEDDVVAAIQSIDI